MKSKTSKQETEVGDIEITRKVPLDKAQGTDPVSKTDTPWTDIWKVEIQDQASNPNPGSPQSEVDISADTSLYT